MVGNQWLLLVVSGYSWLSVVIVGYQWLYPTTPKDQRKMAWYISHIPREIWIFSRILKLNLANMDISQEVAKWH